VDEVQGADVHNALKEVGDAQGIQHPRGVLHGRVGEDDAAKGNRRQHGPQGRVGPEVGLHRDVVDEGQVVLHVHLPGAFGQQTPQGGPVAVGIDLPQAGGFLGVHAQMVLKPPGDPPGHVLHQPGTGRVEGFVQVKDGVGKRHDGLLRHEIHERRERRERHERHERRERRERRERHESWMWGKV
jgi:hypothetical protein